MSDTNKMGRPPKVEGKRKQTGVRLPEEVALQLGHFALDEKKSLNDILSKVIEDWWQSHPKRSKYDKPEEESEKPATKKKATGKAA